MSHGTCPTVNIAADNEQGFIIINLSDFNAEIHTVFGVDAEAAAQAKKDLEAQNSETEAQAQAKIDEAAAKAEAIALAAKANNVPSMSQGIPQAVVQAPWLKPTA